MHTKLTVCALLVIAAGAHAQPAYTEDFESFTLGPVDQQQGWTSPAENQALVVEDETLNRSVRYQLTSPGGSSQHRQEWSIVGAPFNAAYGRLEFDVTVSPDEDDPDNNTHVLATEDTLTGYLNTRVEFVANGEITVYAPVGQSPASRRFEPSSFSAFTPGQTVRLAIETTPAGVVRVYQDELLIHESPEFAAATFGPQRSGRIARLAVWSSTEAAPTASAVTLDNLSFTPEVCQADFDDDGAVGAYELSVVLARWKSGWPGGPADLNADGVIDATDLSQVIAAWGACSE